MSTEIVSDKRNTVKERSIVTITSEQSRAARGLLDWSQTTLATRANLSESTVRDFEKGRRVPSINNLAALRRALEGAGVIFLDSGESSVGGPGVRLATLLNSVDTDDSEVVQYPEFKDGDGGPGSGG